MRRSLSAAVLLCALLALSVGWVPTAAAKTHKPIRRHVPSVTVPRALSTLLRRNRITPAEFHADLRAWVGDLREERALRGWRRQQLADVTTLLHALAADRQMTAPRLPVLFLTLKVNAQYWKSGHRLVYADRVSFPGSELVWEYYPGYGLQLQVLGTFGEANGFYEAGSSDYPQLEQVLSEMQSLAVPRAGGIAWEYYFFWEGGTPPWVSAMAQATGIEAFTNGYLATGNSSYLTEAHDALPLLQTRPPVGVEVPTPLGARFLQYSFAPHTDIINAFLQTLIGLYDYGQVSKDPVALALFNLGNAQAQAELPKFVVNGWSLYQPGQLDNLNYHELVTGFAQSLCQKLAVPIYCNTAATFKTDLTTTPLLAQLTTQAVAGHPFQLRFLVSKAAYVGITVSSGNRRYLYTRALFRAGNHEFRTRKLKPGSYSVEMAATDLAGNYTRVYGSLQVCSASCPPAPPPTTTTTTPTGTTTTPTGTTTTPTTTTPTTTTPTATTTTPTGTTTTPTTTTPGGSSGGSGF